MISVVVSLKTVSGAPIWPQLKNRCHSRAAFFIFERMVLELIVRSKITRTLDPRSDVVMGRLVLASASYGGASKANSLAAKHNTGKIRNKRACFQVGPPAVVL